MVETSYVCPPLLGLLFVAKCEASALTFFFFWLALQFISQSLASPVHIFFLTAQKVSPFASVCSTAGPGAKTQCVWSAVCLRLTRFFPPSGLRSVLST